MTKAELDEIFGLNKEIERVQERIADLEIMSPKMVSGLNKRVAARGAELRELKAQLDKLMERKRDYLCEVTAYIDDEVTDKLVRDIMYQRYVYQRTWRNVAERLERGGNSAANLKRIMERYLYTQQLQ